ncbi:hypothetical protein OWH49_003759 [Escherichia coli]|nr:hypothetical protein [Escherichia coli]
MACASCGGKSRRPLRTTQGGRPVNQTLTRTPQSSGSRPGIRDRIAGLRWNSK